MLEFSTGHKGRADEIVALFRTTFAASEGADVGELVGGLAKDLLVRTPVEDLSAFSAVDDGSLAGCIIFSRLSYDRDDRTVFLLAPVAVETSRQGKGIGQELLRHGLNEIRKNGVDVVVTYGDPNYYSKVGFAQISEQDAAPPLKLQYPHGWLAQSLKGETLAPLIGPSRCVDALNNPDYW